MQQPAPTVGIKQSDGLGNSIYTKNSKSRRTAEFSMTNIPVVVLAAKDYNSCFDDSKY
ncbi:MAG: hypothetical protein IPK61_10615 [Saprospiraceae bacterium]|nr:hypothetical protein [Saprospiraceae bacterium]MBK9376926.1 hypothetical protein [Saprospiraceae bacterium]